MSSDRSIIFWQVLKAYHSKDPSLKEFFAHLKVLTSEGLVVITNQGLAHAQIRADEVNKPVQTLIDLESVGRSSKSSIRGNRVKTSGLHSNISLEMGFLRKLDQLHTT